MLPGVSLDHLAVAAERHADLLPRYRGDLAGEWVSGGGSAGFAAAQVAFRPPVGQDTSAAQGMKTPAEPGMKIEMLMPHMVEVNDFLRRFLDRSGPGPHHLTYKVPDLAAALPVVEAAGYHPVGVQLSSPGWKEAFLHPKDAPGIVVQLAQSAGEWSSPAPPGAPAPRTAEPARLVRVVHLVADLAGALALFRDLLAGEVLTEGDGGSGGAAAVELGWPPAGRLRLVEARSSDDLEWLGGRPGRVSHVELECEDPAGVADAAPRGDGTWVVAPEDNQGTRLVLRAG